eukprot:jgi/Galph1/4284/GphlegSOOS_G2887.1
MYLEPIDEQAKFVVLCNNQPYFLCSVENELNLTCRGDDYVLLWKAGGAVKRKFSWRATNHDVSFPNFFRDEQGHEHIAVGVGDRLYLFGSSGVVDCLQLGYPVAGPNVSLFLTDYGLFVPVKMTKHVNWHKSERYLLLSRKDRQLYPIQGLQDGEKILYCSPEWPLIIVYDDIIENISILVWERKQVETSGHATIVGYSMQRVIEMILSKPKDVCVFHDAMANLCIAILDKDGTLRILTSDELFTTQQQNWNYLSLEKIKITCVIENIAAISALRLCRPDLLDLLCVDRNGCCKIYIGSHEICSYWLIYTSDETVSVKLERNNEIHGIVENLVFVIRALRDPIGSCVSCETDNGNCFRICLNNFKPETQPTLDVLTCACVALSPEWACFLRSLYIYYFHRHDVALQHTVEETNGNEWQSIVAAMNELVEHIMKQKGQPLNLSVSSRMSLFLQDTQNDINNHILVDPIHDGILTTKYASCRHILNQISPMDDKRSTRWKVGTEFEVAKDVVNVCVQEILIRLAQSLHFLYESYKTSILCEQYLAAVASLNKRILECLGWTDWIEHYCRDLLWEEELLCFSDESYQPAYCIFDVLSLVISGHFEDLFHFKSCLEAFGLHNSFYPFQRLVSICHGLQVIFKEENALEELVEIPSLLEDILPSLPCSLAVPFYDALQTLKFVVPTQNNVLLKELVERYLNSVHDDNFSKLYATHHSRTDTVPKVKFDVESMFLEDIVLDSDATKYFSGMEVNDLCIKMRFSADQRVVEVQHLLNSACPLSVDSVDWKSLYEDDNSNVISQTKLLSRLQKNLGVCVGRGAFVLGTYVSNDPTEPIMIPKMCLSIKVPSDSLPLLKLDLSNIPANYLDWPRFHNGVAASLRLFPRETSWFHDSSPESILSRTWILSNRPPHPCPSHAGVLLGLGLTGHLPVLQTTDWYSYLVGKDELTCIGLILGVSCSGRGTMENATTKMLCIHIHHFNPLSFSQPDWDIPISVQAAACLGLGLIYQATCHRLMVEGLLSEMTRKPGPCTSLNQRQSFSLATGFGLGLICLGMGSKSTALEDLHLEEQLYALIDGKKTKSSKTTRQGFIIDSNPNLILEDMPNLDVTAPAALIALCLMYVQSNEERVAHHLVIPQTINDLERLRPDHLYLRILCQQMILWDSVEASEDFLVGLIPNVYKECLLVHLRKEGKEENLDNLFELFGMLLTKEYTEDNLTETVMVILIAGCVSIALRYAGTHDRDAYALVKKVFICLRKLIPLSIFMYLNVLLMALAVILAGSGNLEVFRIIRSFQRSLRHKADNTCSKYGSWMATSMAIGFLFLGGGCCSFQRSPSAIAYLLCSLYPIFPISPVDNQYHLQAFRHLYVLAAEPRFLETRDIRSNLPCFVPLEITLRETEDYQPATLRMMSPCLVPEIASIEKIQVCGPRYMSTIYDASYWQPQLSQTSQGLSYPVTHTGRLVLYVRRRIGQLSYAMDPKGSRGLLSHSFGMFHETYSSNTTSNALLVPNMEEEAIHTFVEHPSLYGFLYYFGKQPFYWSILHESLTQDKPEAIEWYLQTILISIPSSVMASCHSLWLTNLCILSTYLKHRSCYFQNKWKTLSSNNNTSHWENEAAHHPLLQANFIEKCMHQVKQCLESNNAHQYVSLIHFLIHDASSEKEWQDFFAMLGEEKQVSMKYLWMYLQWMRIPPIGLLRKTRQKVQIMMNTIPTAIPHHFSLEQRKWLKTIYWIQHIPTSYHPIDMHVLASLIEKE